jgi:hypothetical protein
MKYLNLKDLLLTIVFAALWIGLIFKNDAVYLWVFQFENINMSYLAIILPIIVYASAVIISRIAKVKYLKKSNE